MRFGSKPALMLVFVLVLTACGGGDEGGAPVQPAPPPAAPAPPPVVGSSGGTVTEPSGASVVVPAGSLSASTTIRVAMDSTGAPPLPADLKSAGNVYVITPHGGDFAVPVEVRIPAPNVALQPNQELKLAKAQPNDEWIVLEDSVLDAGVLRSSVSSFSFFMPVVITYVLPIAQAEPMRVTTSLACSPNNACIGVFGAVTATYTVTTNNGQLPQGCTDNSLRIFTGTSLNYGSTSGSIAIAKTGGSLTRTVDPSAANAFRFGVGRRCTSSWSSYGYGLERAINWVRPPDYPNLAVLNMPAQVDVVEGLVANIDAVLGGGASRHTSPVAYTAATLDDRALIDWQRSDDNGASWRVIANSYQNEANPLPYGAGLSWRYWSVRHGFVATSADQGALIRVRACYTPPAPDAAPPCVTSAPALLNVLQQSALPAIVTAPRSMLVRTGQTASLSVAASGAPAPTLQWQTRPANSSGAWSDVATGTGPTTANYTTAVTALSDNGVQYRVIATNALGSVESAAVTVSVSDLDVAPTIATQPANLGVTSGSDAVFAVDARGTEALSYQWRFNGTAITGANSPVLRLTAVSNANVGSYAVTVSNVAGNAVSNEAILTVTAGTPAIVAPTIVTQPSAVTVNAGNTATFAVGVDGSGPFTFQWRREGVNIIGATSAVYILNPAQLPHAGAYSVVVSNSAGAIVSNNVVLDVTAAVTGVAPDITTQPATMILPLGGSSIMAVGATGSGPLTYQWYQNGVPIQFATQPVLNFYQVTADFVGSYTVTVTNSVSSRTSQVAELILLGAPTITQQPAATTVYEGGTAAFSVTANGSNLRYQWMANGASIPGANQAIYTTPTLVAGNSGAVYSVIVFNAAGLVFSQSAVLTVQVPVPPTVLQEPADASIQAGTTAPLCMAFGGAPPFSVQMNRWDGTQWVSVGGRFPVNGNAQVCTITPPLQLVDNGAKFMFLASNAEGGPFEAMTRTATITVTAAPAITATTLASRSTSGVTANNRSATPTLSSDGNLVAFLTDGTNLVAGATLDPAFGRHAYVRNLTTGVTTLINQTPAGAQSMYGVIEMKLAAGGRYVVFSSLAGDLVADDTNGSQDVFLRDLQTGTTKRLNVLPDGSQLAGTGNGVGDVRLDVSADGRYVIFASFFDLTGAGEELPVYTLFLRDTHTDQTRVVSTGPAGSALQYCAISSNGEYVAYQRALPAPAPETITIYDAEADTQLGDVFSMDRNGGTDYLFQGLSISGNGRYVAFSLRSPTLLGTTTPQIAVIDRNNPATLLVASTGSAGSGIALGDGASSFPLLSDDGRYVVFSTKAINISGGVGNTQDMALMVRDLQTQTTQVASRRANGTGVRTGGDPTKGHAISGDGAFVAFAAYESDVTGGTQEPQIYVSPRP
jgi:hypothetical protein